MGYIKRADFANRRILTNLKENGKWHKLLKYACEHACPDNLDEGLDVHLRGDCVHIYYKGGRILEIKTDVLNLDSNYLYKREDYQGIPRTHMELLKDGNTKELKRRHVKYEGWTKEKAIEVFKSLEKSRNTLLGIKSSEKRKNNNSYSDIVQDPESYFSKAKKVMDDWSDSLSEVTSHKERILQQKISILNRDSVKTDLIVIDIEFSVSNAKDCPFCSGKFHNPRFDIIAIQPNNGNKLVVIELKKGLGAVGWKEDGSFDKETKSGVINHLEKFNDTVGKENNYESFVAEMQGVLDMKVSLGILPKELEEIRISKEKPDFMLAYAGECMEQFLNACKKEKLKCIPIKNEDYPILKL